MNTLPPDSLLPRRLAVVIVHYKTPDLLKDCVASLMLQLNLAPTDNSPPDEILIVDNASGSEHLEKIRPLAQLPGVTLLESPANLGFAGANNLALRRVISTGRSAFYMLLNPDTLLRPEAVNTLMKFLNDRPDVGCVGPRLEDPDGTPQQSAFGPISPLSELIRGANIGPLSRLLHRFAVYGAVSNDPQPAHWLAGACVLMRDSFLESAGLLDDRYFMYYEEVDFFRRAARLKLQTWYEPNALVVHLVGKSSGVNRVQGARRLPDYWFRSRHRYFRKHFGYLGMLAADALWFAGHSLNVTRKIVTGISHSAPATSEFHDLLRHAARELLHPRTAA